MCHQCVPGRGLQLVVGQSSTSPIGLGPGQTALSCGPANGCSQIQIRKSKHHEDTLALLENNGIPMSTIPLVRTGSIKEDNIHFANIPSGKSCLQPQACDFHYDILRLSSKVMSQDLIHSGQFSIHSIHSIHSINPTLNFCFFKKTLLFGGVPLVKNPFKLQQPQRPRE